MLSKAGPAVSLPNIGGHLSLGAKPVETVRQAAQDGFRSLQIFASSPGAWKPPKEDPKRAGAVHAARRRWKIEPLFIHSIYLINLASADPDLSARSRASLAATLRAGAEFGAAGVVTHIGSHAGRGFESVVDQVAAALTEVLAGSPESVDLVLENSAGSGHIIGSELGELASVLDAAGRHTRLKIALDTAHLCAAGWNLRDPGVVELLRHRVAEEIDLDRLVLIHANDSLLPCGSRRDRHANIGEGHIGLEGFRRMLAVPEFWDLPWILETPNLECRAEDLRRLQAMAGLAREEAVRHAS